MRLRFTRKRFLTLITLGVLVPTGLLAYFSMRLQHEMFEVESQILKQYTGFSVDYAISQMQNDIRDREREVYMHFRMVGLLQRFEPQDELKRIETAYPLITHSFLRQLDGTLSMAEADDSVLSTGSSQANYFNAGILSLESFLDMDRDNALAIIDKVLDPNSVKHLLKTADIHFFRGGPENGGPFHMVAFGLFDSMGKAYGVAGFFLNLSHVRATFLADILEDAIEEAETRFSSHFADNLVFYMQDHEENIVYVHQHEGRPVEKSPKSYLAKAELWDVLPGWHLKIDYLGDDFRRSLFVSNSVMVAVMASMAVAGTLFSLKFILREVELSNTKSHFVSNITHELKTPLAAIRLYAETLQQERVKDEAQRRTFLGVINKESVRLTHLINNILDFSRIDMGHKHYTFVLADVGQVVRDVLSSYAYQLREKGAEVQVEVGDDLPRLKMDPDAMSQTMLNLIDNAVKYSQQDKRIDVQVARMGLGAGNEAHDLGRKIFGEQIGEGICIKIRDYGVGIPGSELKKVFEAFYRVNKSLEHDVKGSGLGLAVVRHVVEAHKGALYIQSRRGRGSTFSICLPLPVT